MECQRNGNASGGERQKKNKVNELSITFYQMLPGKKIHLGSLSEIDTNYLSDPVDAIARNVVQCLSAVVPKLIPMDDIHWTELFIGL